MKIRKQGSSVSRRALKNVKFQAYRAINLVESSSTKKNSSAFLALQCTKHGRARLERLCQMLPSTVSRLWEWQPSCSQVQIDLQWARRPDRRSWPHNTDEVLVNYYYCNFLLLLIKNIIDIFFRLAWPSRLADDDCQEAPQQDRLSRPRNSCKEVVLKYPQQNFSGKPYEFRVVPSFQPSDSGFRSTSLICSVLWPAPIYWTQQILYHLGWTPAIIKCRHVMYPANIKVERFLTTAPLGQTPSTHNRNWDSCQRDNAFFREAWQLYYPSFCNLISLHFF